MKYLIILIALFIASQHLSAQNCGMVTGFTYTIDNNSNGTKTYRFQVEVKSTSGNKRSVKITIKCSNHTFISNKCEQAKAEEKTINYGPYTVNACTDEIVLSWAGYSNEECEGQPCNPLQSFKPLPVELTSFDVSKNKDSAILNWATASEKNNEKFIIERSNNGIEYELIGEVSGNGTTNEAKKYKHIDDAPSFGVNYYRLKQVDFDGKYEYSPINSIEINPINDIAVFPTIFTEFLNVSLPEQMVDEDISVFIFNMQGANVFTSKFQGNTMNKLTMPSLSPGQYILHIGNGNFTKNTMIIRK